MGEVFGWFYCMLFFQQRRRLWISGFSGPHWLCTPSLVSISTWLSPHLNPALAKRGIRSAKSKALAPFERYSGKNPTKRQSTPSVLLNLMALSRCHHPKGYNRPRWHFCKARLSDGIVIPIPAIASFLFPSTITVMKSRFANGKYICTYWSIWRSVSCENP